MIILHKKRDMKDIENYRPVSLHSHMYKLFTWIIPKNEWKRFLMKTNQDNRLV